MMSPPWSPMSPPWSPRPQAEPCGASAGAAAPPQLAQMWRHHSLSTALMSAQLTSSRPHVWSAGQAAGLDPASWLGAALLRGTVTGDNGLGLQLLPAGKCRFLPWKMSFLSTDFAWLRLRGAGFPLQRRQLLKVEESVSTNKTLGSATGMSRALSIPRL